MSSRPPVQALRYSTAGFCLSLVFGALAGHAGTSAELGPADVAEQWGLVGDWAMDCRQPPAKDNAYYSFLRQGSGLQVRRDLGFLKDENQVLSAGITSEGQLELVTEYKVFSRVMTSRYLKDGADQFHAVSNKDDKNVYAIRDGKSTATGSPAPVMSRCSKTDKE